MVMDNYSEIIPKIKNAYEVQDFLVGKVTYIGPSYLIVKIDDYPCIMSKNEVELFNIRNFQQYLNKDIVVKVISIDKNSLNGFDIKVSHRAVAEEVINANNLETFEDVKKNHTYKAIVKDIKEYGIFVSLGAIDGLVHVSRLPEEFKETPENFIEIGSIVDARVVSKNFDKSQISLSIPSLNTTTPTKSPFEIFKESLTPNETILLGKVVYLERDCVTLHVNHQGNKFTVYIKKDDLTWEKKQHAADVVFIGEELRIRFVNYENNRLYFDLKWQQKDIYPKELFLMDTDELLSTLKIFENKFVAKINILYNNRTESEEKEVKGAFANNILAAGFQDNNSLLIDKYSGHEIIAYVPAKYAYALENGQYYTFTLKAASQKKREDEHRPYMFSAQLENSIPIENPYKEQVEKSFKENKTPKSNRESASYLKEIGADMYTDRDRMFYELLQNADDSSSARGVKVMVQIKDNYLIFTHDGLSFSRQDFRSIVSTANSTKRLDRKKTGYKGIGFKSVFTDSEKVYIKTGGFFFVFDKTSPLFNDFRAFYKYVNPIYTEEQLNLFFEDYKDYEKEFEGVDHLPWQLLPFWVEEIPEELRGTTFSRNCNVAIALNIGASADNYKEIIKGIIQKPRFMLFLRNTQRIQFEDKKWEILSIAKHTNIDTNVVTLKNSFDSDEKEVSYIVREGSDIPVNNEAFEEAGIPMSKECKLISGREKWTMYQTVDGTRIPITSIPERIIAADTTTMSYAFMLDENKNVICIPEKTPSLYAYLPMEDRRYLFPFYINADFELSSNRQEAKRVSVWNEYIFYNIGKNIVSWVATIASISHKNYLELLPKILFVEELEESKTDRIAIQFNRGYKEALSSSRFILNDKNEIVSQDEIVIDESGFAKIIGPEAFCSIMDCQKRLPNVAINSDPLLNTEIFNSIEHIQNSTVVERILNVTYRKRILRYWISISDNDRNTVLTHIANIPGNRKNLDANLLDIPAYKTQSKLWSFNKLLMSRDTILRTSAIVGIEEILEKMGFCLTEDEEQTHPFHVKLEQNIAAYTLHIFDVVSKRTSNKDCVLNPKDKIKLFTHFTNTKLEIPHETLSSWGLFCNQNGVVTSVSKLTHIDGSLYNSITNDYAICEEEYILNPRLIDRYLMKEKDQYEKIVVEGWQPLINDIGQSELNALALYKFVSTTYLVAEHEQASEKEIELLHSKPFVFANEQMRPINDVLINENISKDLVVKQVVESITGKFVPSAVITTQLISKPFFSKQQSLDKSALLEDKILSSEDVVVLLSYCDTHKDTIFKKYSIAKAEGGYKFNQLGKTNKVVFTPVEQISSFISKNCSRLIQLPSEFSKFYKLDGILSDEELLIEILDCVNLKEHSAEIIQHYLDSVSPVKQAYINHLSVLELSENSCLNADDIVVKTMKMASTIEKPETSMFQELQNKIFVVSGTVRSALSSIKQQHSVEVNKKIYPLSKLVPNEDKMAQLVDTLKERIESFVTTDFANKLFGQEVDKRRAGEIFTSLNKSNIILDNGVQISFMLEYSSSINATTKLACKVWDSSTSKASQTLLRDWIIDCHSFVDKTCVLSEQYSELSKYISLPYAVGVCHINKNIDSFNHIKSDLTEQEISDLLDFVNEAHISNKNIKTEDVEILKSRLSINTGYYVISKQYSLQEERLPGSIDKWRLSSEMKEKEDTLKDVLGIFTEDSDIVNVRRYLAHGTPLSVASKNSILSQMTCNWIEKKNLILNDEQFLNIQDVIEDKDFVCEIDSDKLNGYATPDYRFMVFADYYVYLYSGEIPWFAKLRTSDYIFHKYCQDDIALIGENIFVNREEEHSISDLIRSLVNSDGFTTDDFLKFWDQYQNKIKGTLDGEIDDDIDEDARSAANETAKQEAINWLAARGYDTNNIQTDFSILKGVRKNAIEYHIVVKSFRSKSRELKINPNEWLYLLNKNSRLMLYLGHMKFAVVDRETLLGNHDFLKLRISSSNFSVDGNKLEKTLSKLARDIQYFERTHFVFEHLHDSILSRANSLDDYGLYKVNKSGTFNDAEDEDIL